MSIIPSVKKLVNPTGDEDGGVFGRRKGRGKGRRKRKRTEPLPGTKGLLPSKRDGQLRDLLVTRFHEGKVSPKAGNAIGIAGFSIAVAMLVGYWLDKIVEMPAAGPALMWLGFCCIHLCMLFSQILSNGKSTMGGLAMAVLYAGIFISVIIEGLFL